MTAHMYGSPGGFDHYGSSVPIHRDGEIEFKPEAGVDYCPTCRDQPWPEPGWCPTCYGEPLPIKRHGESLIVRADLEALRDLLAAQLNSNPPSCAFDRGLVFALDEIDRILNADIIKGK